MRTEPLGLRERKRAQTRRRLEEAAIGLALRDGLDKVTVDAISERADVSPRTFFNYFDTKEDAVLGVRPPDISERTLAEHRARYAGATLLESMVGLLIGVLGPSIDEPAFRRSRIAAIRQQPQLLDRLIARMARVTEQLTEAASGLLAERDRLSGAEPAADPDAVAETLVMTCIGGIKAATRQWAATDSEISPQELEQRAVSLVREAIGKLT